MAIQVGFDGVELHAASGYFHMQFLTPGVNQRTDRYGGSAANRVRFVVETLEVLIAAAGSAGKVGIKISPAMPFNDCTDPDPSSTYTELVKTISLLGLAYLHAMQSPGFDVAPLRALYGEPFLLGGGFYTRAAAENALDSGAADAIVFGKLFVSNPDLPADSRGEPRSPRAIRARSTRRAPGVHRLSGDELAIQPSKARTRPRSPRDPTPAYRAVRWLRHVGRL